MRNFAANSRRWIPVAKRIKGTLLTPLDFTAPVKAGRRRFWKQILPVTSIDYDGQKIDFDPKFHKDLELAAAEGVYPSVPLIFADGSNRHNESPRNWSGEIIKFENRGKDGTWGLIEADRDAAKIINKNPKMGVSARISQNVQRAGKVYPRAVRHVLMTMFPRVSNMEPWQAVDLSEDAGELVVDLTAVEFKKGKQMAKKAKTATVTVPRDADGNIDLSELDDDGFESLLDLAAAVAEDERIADYVDEDEDEVEEEKRKIKRKKSKTKVTVEKDEEVDDPDGDDEDEEETDEDTDLSEPLTQAEVDDLRSLRTDRAKERWQSERGNLLRKGVPPFMLDLAEPVMESVADMNIDLSDDESVDPREVIRQMLSKSVGMIDLSEEEGSAVDLSEGDYEGKDLYEAWVEGS
jgi:hypothetical protein